MQLFCGNILLSLPALICLELDRWQHVSASI